MKFSIKIIKTCKCGNKFEVKPSDNRVSCNKCLMGSPRKEDMKMVIESLKTI